MATSDSRFSRVLKVKNAVVNFICPLCSAQRGLRYSSRLSFKHYLHITMISVVLSLLLFPLMGLKSMFMVFGVWAIYETVYKSLYRKEIPCPHCGFDATWYKRDVRVAKRLVEQFWAEQNQIKTINSENKKGVIENTQDSQISSLSPQVPPAALMDNIADDLLNDSL